MYDIYIYIYHTLIAYYYLIQAEKKHRNDQGLTSMDISHAAQFHKPQTNQLHPKPSNYVTIFEPILLIL